MDRRGFLGAMLAACAAPAIVRAGSLMRINPAIVPDDRVVIITQYGTDIGLMVEGTLGERIQLIREMIAYEVLYGITSVDQHGERKIIAADWRKGPPIYNAHWMKLK